MSKRVAFILIIIAFGAGAGAGTLGLLWATGGNATPSRDVGEVVPTLSLDAAPDTDIVALNENVAALATEISVIAGQTDEITTQLDAIQAALNDGAVQAAANPTAPVEPTATAMPEEASASVPERALYRITEDESQVRFKIDEILLGNPTTVVAATKRVAGDVIVNFSDPSASQVGQIAINARTFKTDNEFRDQSIRGQILQSSRDVYEFINFVPVELLGLPDESVSVGDTIAFQIAGDLTVKGVTQRVTFAASVTVVSEERIEGFVSAEVLYSDFDLTINAPPNVSGVSDEVTMELDLVALRVDE
jgi:polyisoprenoid-binding protein YceI